MLCVHCSHDNPPGTKLCQKCNAKMLQMAPSGNPMPNSTLEIDDKTHYLPANRYATEHIYNLSTAAAAYLEGASEEPMMEAFEVFKSRFEELQTKFMPEIMPQLLEERANHPEFDFAAQIIYQLNHGTNLVEQGIGMFQTFVESGDEPLLAQAVTCMTDGNDHICLANELIATRADLFGKMIEQIQKETAQ